MLLTIYPIGHGGDMQDCQGRVVGKDISYHNGVIVCAGHGPGRVCRFCFGLSEAPVKSHETDHYERVSTVIGYVLLRQLATDHSNREGA